MASRERGKGAAKLELPTLQLFRQRLVAACGYLTWRQCPHELRDATRASTANLLAKRSYRGAVSWRGRATSIHLYLTVPDQSPPN